MADNSQVAELQPCNQPLEDLRHEEFAQLLGSGKSLAHCARTLGIIPKTAADWRDRPEIEPRWRFLRARHLKALQMEPDEVLVQMAHIARFDPRMLADPSTGKALPLHEWPDELAAATAGVEIEETVDRGTDGVLATRTMKVKAADKVRALEMLAKHHGLFQTDHDQAGAGIGKTLGDILKGHAEATRGVSDLIKD